MTTSLTVITEVSAQVIATASNTPATTTQMVDVGLVQTFIQWVMNLL